MIDTRFYNPLVIVPIDDRPSLSPPDDAAAGSSEPASHIPMPPSATENTDLRCGRVLLDSAALRSLRQSRLLSQQDLANDCWRRNIRVSIATIKRAESGRAVRYRIARELARCFEVPVVNIIRA